MGYVVKYYCGRGLYHNAINLNSRVTTPLEFVFQDSFGSFIEKGKSEL